MHAIKGRHKHFSTVTCKAYNTHTYLLTRHSGVLRATVLESSWLSYLKTGWLRLMEKTWALGMASTCRRQMGVCERAGVRYRNIRVLVYVFGMWVCTGMHVVFVYHCLTERKSRKRFPFLQTLFTSSPPSHVQIRHCTQKCPQIHTHTHVKNYESEGKHKSSNP